MNVLNFENLPNAVAQLIKGQSELKALLLNKLEHQPQTENPLGIEDVSKLIGKTVPTIYGYCQRNEIPYYKNGNRLIFWKSEIIQWLKQGKVKTIQEIEANADAFLSNHKKGLK
jgi:predicted DNA-binding transcriptional regulator AlpA